MQSDLFHSGVRPAINAGLSVSRVGGSAQIKAIKKVSGTLRLDLAAFRELEAFTQFGSDLDDATKARLERGKRTVEILKQGLHQTMDVEKQVISIFSLTNGFLDDVKLQDILRFESDLHEFFLNNKEGKEVLDEITKTAQLPDVEKIKGVIEKFKKVFV